MASIRGRLLAIGFELSARQGNKYNPHTRRSFCQATLGGFRAGNRCLGVANHIITSNSNEWHQHQSRALCTSGSLFSANQVNGSGNDGSELLLTKPSKHVAHLQLNRPKVKNAFSFETAKEMVAILDKLDEDSTVRCVILSGSGADLTSGVDLKSFMTVYQQLQATEDVGRRAKLLKATVERFQAPFKRMHEFGKPVICVQHGLCLGLGMELAACSDIRYCSRDTKMAVREVLIGIAADVGSLQLMPKLTSNQSLLNELVYTGRHLTVEEAQSLGFVSRLLETKEQALEKAMETAELIAKQSPVAVQGSKQNLRFSSDKPFTVGLDYNAIWNMAMMQSEDVPKAIGAILSKQSDPVKYENY